MPSLDDMPLSLVVSTFKVEIELRLGCVEDGKVKALDSV